MCARDYKRTGVTKMKHVESDERTRGTTCQIGQRQLRTRRLWSAHATSHTRTHRPLDRRGATDAPVARLAPPAARRSAASSPIALPATAPCDQTHVSARCAERRKYSQRFKKTGLLLLEFDLLQNIRFGRAPSVAHGAIRRHAVRSTVAAVERLCCNCRHRRR